MARIGSFTVLIWNGYLREPLRRKRLHRREGVHGTGVVLGSYVADPAQIHTETTAANETAARALAHSYRGLDGTIITVVDSYGVEHRGVCVLGVTTTYYPAVSIAGGAGANHTYIVEAEWTLLPPYSKTQLGTP